MLGILVENQGGVFENTSCTIQWAFSQNIDRRRKKQQSKNVAASIEQYS
jgi:hypothetical protein